MKIPTLFLPGSKSITNRALLLATLSGEPCLLKNPLESDDTYYMSQVLSSLGVKIIKETYFCPKSQREFPQWQVQGLKDFSFLKNKEFDFFIGNAGTTIRFLTPFLAFLKGGTYILRGEERMHQRPIKDLVDPLIKAGAQIQYLEKEGYPPLKITGANLLIKEIEVDASKSSQYLSALLMTLLHFNPHVCIKASALVSKPYIDTTLEIMQIFGLLVKNQNYQVFSKASGFYQGKNYTIPADASSASYFFAGAFLLNQPLKLNLGSQCLQGDFLFTEILREMGGIFELSKEESLFLSRKSNFLGITVDMNAIPDTVQTLATLALFAQSPTQILNVENLRIKETDRLLALENELIRLGASVATGIDFIHIRPAQGFYYYPATIQTYQDHRMAMSFALAQLKIPQLVIENPQVVSKSFANFWDVWESFKAN